MPWHRPLLVALLLGLMLLSWWHWRPAPDEVRRTRFLMGTSVEVLAEGDDRDRLTAAVDAAFAEMARLDKLLSLYDQESDVARINRATGPVTVAPETAEVLAVGLELARTSSGALDLGLGRLKELWNIEGDSPQVPSAAAVAQALAGTGPQALVLDGQQVTRRSAGLMVDLGGIAKGYIVDRAIRVLQAHGVRNAAVNAGGDMYLLGQRRQRPWRIGIQHPREPEAVIETVEASARAVVTSGDYERFFVRDGVRYHHLFDPSTGYPATACQSVSILAETAVLADGLATALFVLGPERGLALMQHYPGREALILDADGRRFATAGWPGAQASP